jgi:hypothetical protein
MPNNIRAQHGALRKSRLGKGLPIDDNKQKECGHVVANLDRYTPPCNAVVSSLRHEKWHDYHTSTSPGLRHFHQ